MYVLFYYYILCRKFIVNVTLIVFINFYGIPVNDIEIVLELTDSALILMHEIFLFSSYLGYYESS